MTQVQDQGTRRERLEVNVRKYDPAERAQLTAVMAKAFDDDPIANWFAAQDAKRAQRVHDFMDVGLRITAPHEEIYTTDGIRGGPAGPHLASGRWDWCNSLVSCRP